MQIHKPEHNEMGSDSLCRQTLRRRTWICMVLACALIWGLVGWVLLRVWWR